MSVYSVMMSSVRARTTDPPYADRRLDGLRPVGLVQRGKRIPGNPKTITRVTKEWVCPDCDYFEEFEEEK